MHNIFAGLGGPEKANLVKISHQKVFETGAHGTCIITDGPTAHLTMMKKLGAKLNPDNMMPFFPHLSDSNV